MKVDYDFCKKNKLTSKDLLIWLDLDDTLDYTGVYSTNFFGRNMMLIGDDEMTIRISCFHKDFDKWSNSEEMTFDINKDSERRKFIDWVIEQRKE